LTPADIKINLENVRHRIAQACLRSGRSVQDITIVAVTKTENETAIQTAFELGIRNFGENRVQEADKKILNLSCLRPRPVWHMIGHLQSNKIKTALERFDIIQSIDSIDIAVAVNGRTRRQMPVMIQVNISGEESKGGIPVEDFPQSFELISRLPNLGIKGLMTIAPLVEDAEKVRPVFRKLKELGDKFKLKQLSMGMTDDFEVAIEEGATMVRIGRALFGERI
jgi:pyridoxal phosphate enzyme (YggS family)